jgi:hypothetical protein
MFLPSIKDLHEATGLLVDIALLLGAIVAVVKFRLFNILGHRWRSELTCNHHVLPDSTVVFTADYTISNTGQRPLRLNTVTIRLTAARDEASLVLPDESKIFAERIFQSGTPALKGLFQIEPGERTIFPIRAHLPELDEVMFVLCEFTLKQKREPAAYRGFYVKSRPAHNQNETEPTRPQVKPPADDDLTDFG